ncbi:MAG: glycosyltransferase [Bacteroidales bacterium]|nr:glycosyltransferase [Bacteroidales bacterium]
MKILVLLSRFPYPLEKGDKLRAYHQIRHLAKNHEIHLCALNDIQIKPEYRKALDPFCKSVHVIDLPRVSAAWNIVKAFLTGKPLQVGYFFNANAKKQINRIINEIQPDHIFCQLIRVTEYVRDMKIPKTLDYQDVFSKGVDRRRQSARFYMKPVLRLEYKRLLKYEHDIFSDFDHKTIISAPDRDLIPHPDREKIEVVINGVDTDFFRPMPMEKEYDLVFTGNMGYPPNVNAANFLVKEILPLVRQKLPEVKVMLAGATPHPSVQALAGKNVTVTGWVDDIRECYGKARIFIAPMRIGTGLQNKLLEAMAMKIPSITSQLANSALKATPEQEILVGQSAQEFAAHILRLLEDATYANEIAKNGYTFVHQNYNWASATRKLENLMVNTP